MSQTSTTNLMIDGPTIPESWPPAEPLTPVRARRIRWWLAPLVAPAALLCPRRIGPHLGESSLAAAYLAHWFWALVAVGGTFALLMETQDQPHLVATADVSLNPFYEIRRSLAGSVLLLYGAFGDPFARAPALIAIVGIEIAIWPAALLLLPFYAHGEGPRRTYLRCVKLLLWSTVYCAPLFWLSLRGMAYLADRTNLGPAIAALLPLVLINWWLLSLLRMGGRYAGPAAGPRWNTREPRCERCGYSLVTLPLLARCPECGLQVDESLPEHRRPPAFATARGLFASTKAFWQTTGEALNLRRFARDTTIWTHHRAARNYVLQVAIVTGLLAFGGFIVLGIVARELALDNLAEDLWYTFLVPLFTGQLLDQDYGYYNYEYPVASMFGAFGVAWFVILWVMLCGVFTSWFGFRDVASRLVVLCYASAWLPVVVLLALLGASVIVVLHVYGSIGDIKVPGFGYMDGEMAIGMVVEIPAAAALFASFIRLRWALREVRWANA